MSRKKWDETKKSKLLQFEKKWKFEKIEKKLNNKKEKN